jgi:hypothetical protein
MRAELTQVQHSSVRFEVDYEYKYRFLTYDSQGNIVPLYDKSQNINGGAGDLMLNFTGAPGSGFEFCDPTTQTLTRGSQYQTSFLPEFASGDDYKVGVRATYKDFLPIDFDLTVRYLPNLDGKTKFVDLGTHVFFHSSTQRPSTNYKFMLHGVTDERVSDDQDDYSLNLSHDGGKPYFTLEG